MITIIFNNNCEQNGEITARIIQLFNQVRTKQVRSQVRTKIMTLILVSSSKVSNMVSTEKVKCSIGLIMGVISIKNSIISMVVWRLDLYLNYIKRQGVTQAVQKVKYSSLVGNKLDTGIQLINAVLVDTKADTNLKVRSKYAPKPNLLMRTNLIIQHVRREFCETIKKENYLLGLANFSRQTAITQAEKFVPSFFTCSSICSIKSWGKRMFFNCDLLFLLPVAIVNSLLYKIRRLNNNKKVLTCLHTKLYIGIYTPDNSTGYTKQCPEVLPTLSRHLTANIKDTNAMANSNNTLHPKIGQQSKLFKFFDFSTAQVVQTTATTEQKARNNLGKQTLIFIARKPINPVFNHVNNWGYAHA